jgi:hypothetical protein
MRLLGFTGNQTIGVRISAPQFFPISLQAAYSKNTFLLPTKKNNPDMKTGLALT